MEQNLAVNDIENEPRRLGTFRDLCEKQQEIDALQKLQQSDVEDLGESISQLKLDTHNAVEVTINNDQDESNENQENNLHERRLQCLTPVDDEKQNEQPVIYGLEQPYVVLKVTSNKVEVDWRDYELDKPYVVEISSEDENDANEIETISLLTSSEDEGEVIVTKDTNEVCSTCSESDDEAPRGGRVKRLSKSRPKGPMYY